MKELVKMSRLTGALEKLFRMINHDFFNDALPAPIITVQDGKGREFGHYSVYPIWTVKGEEYRHEINIAPECLYRPVEETIATMLHECVHHYCNTVLHEQDTSNHGVYHNKVFRREAEAHGLICKKGSYGWNDTSSELSDRLIEWVLLNNIPEIHLNRATFICYGTDTEPPKPGASEDMGEKQKKKKPSSKRILQCPQCGIKVDAHTQKAVVGCRNCLVKNLENAGLLTPEIPKTIQLSEIIQVG